MKHYDLKEMQNRVIQNKIQKGFNVTDVEKEFCLLYGEVAEFYDAWRKKLPTVGEEMADVAIYLLGLAEILQVDLEEEIIRKMEINEKRYYKVINGVNTRMPDDGHEKISVDCTVLHEQMIEAVRDGSWPNCRHEMVEKLRGYKTIEFIRLFSVKDKLSTQEEISILILRCCDAGRTVIIRDDIISGEAFKGIRENLRKEIEWLLRSTEMKRITQLWMIRVGRLLTIREKGLMKIQSGRYGIIYKRKIRKRRSVRMGNQSWKPTRNIMRMESISAVRNPMGNRILI